MHRDERGFTLVELMITMVVFVFVIAGASQVFTALLTQYKQQSRIAESNIEGIVGLEIMRRDLEHAGFGLPWEWTHAASNEAINDPDTRQNDTNYNDTAANAVPRAFVSGDDVGWTSGGVNVAGSKSDVLVIKATNVASSEASQRWTYIDNTGATNRIKNVGSEDNPAEDDRITVIQPSVGGQRRVLRTDDVTGTFWTLFKNDLDNFDNAFEPDAYSMQYNVLYGISDSGTPRMPFNRADYYVRRPASGMPGRCAPNTGILYKATVNHADGGHNGLPILDCVADMQVDYWIDASVPLDGSDWPPVNDISGLTAEQIRDRLMEVRVYIVAQEGQKDPNYDCTNGGTRQCVSVTETLGGSSRTLIDGGDFANLATLIGDPEFKHYRWKLYTIVVQPNNLR